MKAVILAAGLGSRLRPITDNVPKCMVEVNGIPIIDKQIDNLRRNGVTEVAIVSGYKAELLRSHIKKDFPFVTMIRNLRYEETNNMYSLFLAKGFVNGEEFLLMNGDVYFDSSVIEGLLASQDKSLIACDRREYLDESMKITLENGKISHISKKISKEDHYAVSIDVYRISKRDCAALFSEIDDIIIRQGDEKSWTEVAIDKVFDRTSFLPYVITGRWVEIDNHDDLAIAQAIFTGDSLS